LTFALPIALALAVSPAVPVAAQESPAPSVCPNVSYVASEDQARGPANQPVTITVGSDVQPAETPDRWTLTRISPAPEVLLQTAPSGPSATFTMTASETTTYRITAEGPEGCGPAHADFTRTVTSTGASPTPSPSPSPSGNGGPDYCRGTDPETGKPYNDRGERTFTANPLTITAGDRVTVDLRIPGPYNRVSAGIFGYQWVTPTKQGGYETISSTGNGSGPFGPGEAATRTVVIAPTNNTKVSWGGAFYCGPTNFHGDVFAFNPTIINVAPRLSLDATRTGPRTYVFSGVATTPGQVLNLYRVNADGSQVLTAQVRATSASRWSITRTFLGSGRFGFVVRTGRTMANAPGASNVRPTLVF